MFDTSSSFIKANAKHISKYVKVWSHVLTYQLQFYQKLDYREVGFFFWTKSWKLKETKCNVLDFGYEDTYLAPQESSVYTPAATIPRSFSLYCIKIVRSSLFTQAVATHNNQVYSTLHIYRYWSNSCQISTFRFMT